MSIRRVRVGDVLELRQTPITVQPEKEYRTLGILNRGRGVFERPVIRGIDTKYRTLYRVHSGQLIFSKLFAWEGSVAMVDETHDSCFVSSEFPSYEVDFEKVDPDYLWHVVTWDGFTESLARGTTGMGQRRQRVNPNAFESITIPLPNLAEQRRITAYLNGLTVKSAWIVRQSEHRMKSASIVAGRLVEQLEGTAHIELGHLLTPKASAPVQETEAYPIAGVYSFGRGLIQRPTIRGSETKYKAFTRLGVDDVVYSKLGAFEGAVAVVDSEHDGRFVSTEFPTFSLTGREHLDPNYLRHVLSSPSFGARLAARSTGVGARQRRVRPEAFLALDIPVPSMQQQRQLTRLLDRTTQVNAFSNRRNQLAAALLPAARNEIFNAMR